MILSEIDSCNGPIKLAYFVTQCSNQVYSSINVNILYASIMNGLVLQKLSNTGNKVLSRKKIYIGTAWHSHRETLPANSFFNKT